MKKTIIKEELKNVSGGISDAGYVTVRCPKCSSKDVVSTERGSGCSKESYWLCQNCGHEWK